MKRLLFVMIMLLSSASIFCSDEGKEAHRDKQAEKNKPLPVPPLQEHGIMTSNGLVKPFQIPADDTPASCLAAAKKIGTFSPPADESPEKPE